jgi:hypothetical protein
MDPGNSQCGRLDVCNFHFGNDSSRLSLNAMIR